jgi:hypothetical protein
MMLKVQIALLVTVALLAGCGEVIVFGHTVREGHAASEVKAAPVAMTAATATETVVSPAIQRVREVTLSLTPQAAGKVANDSRFNAGALLDAIKVELRSRRLFDVNGLDVAGSRASITAEIFIDDYALRPTTNFVLLGSTINAGTLSGNLVLRDEHGNELQRRRIETQARVSIPESGEAANSLWSLYHEFAVAAANSLSGTPAKSNATLDQPPR